MKLYNIVFSPTGGTKKVADYLTGALEGEVTTVDLTDSKLDFDSISLTKEDAAVISVPSYGGRVPAVAVERLSQVHGSGARAVLVCVYGNRAYEDTLVELEDAAKHAGFQIIAAVAAVAEHSIARLADPTERTQRSFPILPSRFGLNSLKTISLSPQFPATVPIKRPEAPVWCPSPQKSVSAAACACRHVPFRPSTRRTRKRWMIRRASPVCAASPYAPTTPARQIPSC